GFGLLVVGTGTIAWSEQRIPSGLAALLVATVPLWTVVLDRLVHGIRVGLVTTLGLVAGLIGVALLLQGGGSVDLVAATAVVIASLGWAAASLYARRREGPSPLTAAGLQMVTAAGFLAVAGGARGELGHVQLERISAASAVAF